jgi:hypothetical protein
MNESSKVPAKFEYIIIIPSGVMNFQSRKSTPYHSSKLLKPNKYVTQKTILIVNYLDGIKNGWDFLNNARRPTDGPNVFPMYFWKQFR